MALTGVALGLNLLLSQNTATSKPNLIWNGFGVNIHFTDPAPGELQRMKAAGFQYARMDFFWDATEKQIGKYDFSAYERLLKSLQSIGIRPLWILDYSNELYQKGAPTTPESRRAFSKWAAAAVTHFKGQEIVWEIWNEPNLDGFWPPRSSAEDYQRLVIEASKEIRGADPNCRLITGGLSGFDFKFFGKFLTTEILGLVDGVAVHPYRGSGPETVWNDYAKLRSMIKELAPPGRKDLPIINSEWGYSTFEGGISEGRQALYLGKSWLVSAACGVPISIFYDWKDDGPNPRENEHRFGTVRQDLSPKPSYYAAQSLLRIFDGCVRFRREDTIDPLKWLITGAGKNKLVQAEWHQKSGEPIKFRTLSLSSKGNRNLHEKLTSESGSNRTIPVVNLPVKVTFAPPMNNYGWFAFVEKPFVKEQRVEFRYTRKSNGAKVTCFFTAKGLRSAENLAMTEDEFSVVATMDGSSIGKCRLRRVSFAPSDFQKVIYQDNVAKSGIDIDAGDQISFPYQFEPGWMFLGIQPKAELAIPEEASKLHLWVKMDGSPNPIRARFRDETGRTFQVNLGTMQDAADRDGWRAITIPLDGTGEIISWGGEEGAKPTGKRTWESLILIDSANRTAPQPGRLEIGSAAYELFERR
jgi:hypothetical protein